MAQQYWFKTHKRGYGWQPNTWKGWLTILLYIALAVYSFTDVYAHNPHTPEAIAWNFLPRVLFLSAILVVVTYLTGEPPTWKPGMKAEEKTP